MEYKPLTYFCNINMGQSPDSNTYNNKSIQECGAVSQ